MKQENHETAITQAQIAGGAIAPPNEAPSQRQYLRDFELTSTLGCPVRLADYRGRASLVLILSGQQLNAGDLLLEAARRYPEIRGKDAEVLAILCSPRELNLATAPAFSYPYPILLDDTGKLHRELGAVDSTAIYITDRFGEVFARYIASEGEPLPQFGEILSRLEFISFQCPECEPPEWPV